MKFKFFKTIHSTQDYLVKNYHLLSKDGCDHILIATAHQTKGHGRQGKQWYHCQEQLAFSLTLHPSQVTTLTTIEISLLLIDFFNLNFNRKIRLKWPNDLIYNKGKCGGIIANLVKSDAIVMGIGLNLSPIATDLDTDYLPAYIDIDKGHNYRRDLPQEIYQFILDHRLKPDEVRSRFNDKCIHNKKTILIKDGEKIVQGKFIGIGEYGEAIIEDAEGREIKMMNGSLRVQGLF